MDDQPSYHIAGSYYEACNCDAVCPCRRQGEVPGGRSTYGDCDFLLSWRIMKGHMGTDTRVTTIVGASGALDGRLTQHHC